MGREDKMFYLSPYFDICFRKFSPLSSSISSTSSLNTCKFSFLVFMLCNVLLLNSCVSYIPSEKNKYPSILSSLSVPFSSPSSITTPPNMPFLRKIFKSSTHERRSCYLFCDGNGLRFRINPGSDVLDQNVGLPQKMFARKSFLRYYSIHGREKVQPRTINSAFCFFLDGNLNKNRRGLLFSKLQDEDTSNDNDDNDNNRRRGITNKGRKDNVQEELDALLRSRRMKNNQRKKDLFDLIDDDVEDANDKARNRNRNRSKKDKRNGSFDEYSYNLINRDPFGVYELPSWLQINQKLSAQIIAVIFLFGIGTGVTLDSAINGNPKDLSSRDAIDRNAPNPVLCAKFGSSAIVLDQRVFVSFNPFSIFVTQADTKPGCVLFPSNAVAVLQRRNLITEEELQECKNANNTWAFVGDLGDKPQLSCVYQSDDAQNEFLSNPKVGLGEDIYDDDLMDLKQNQKE